MKRKTETESQAKDQIGRSPILISIFHIGTPSFVRLLIRELFESLVRIICFVLNPDLFYISFFLVYLYNDLIDLSKSYLTSFN